MIQNGYDPDLSKRADEELHMTEKQYSLLDAAKLLHVSVSTIHGYLRDTDLNLQEVWDGAGRKRYITAEDIKHIWMLRHTFYYGKRPRRKRGSSRSQENEQVQTYQEPNLVIRTDKTFDWAS